MRTGGCTNTQEHERAGLYKCYWETQASLKKFLFMFIVHVFVIAVSYHQVSLSVLDQAACPPAAFSSSSSPESISLPSLTGTLPLNGYQTPEPPKISSHSKTQSTTADPKAL